MRASAALLLAAALPMAPLPAARAAPGLLGNAGSTVGGVVGGALGSGAGGAAGGPAGAAAGGGAAGSGAAAGGSTGAAGGGGAAARAGAATIVAAAGVGDLVDAELAGRTFLASPVATRVAPGRGANNTAVVKAVYTDSAGRPCRVVEQRVTIDGETVEARGTICRLPDGRWALVPRGRD
jgi:surface antigen